MNTMEKKATEYKKYAHHVSHGAGFMQISIARETTLPAALAS